MKFRGEGNFGLQIKISLEIWIVYNIYKNMFINVLEGSKIDRDLLQVYFICGFATVSLRIKVF